MVMQRQCEGAVVQGDLVIIWLAAVLWVADVFALTHCSASADKALHGFSCFWMATILWCGVFCFERTASAFEVLMVLWLGPLGVHTFDMMAKKLNRDLFLFPC